MFDTYEAEKAVVLAFYEALEFHNGDLTQLSRFFAPNCRWIGFHPFDEHIGWHSVANAFWAPLKASLTSLQRRQDIFFAGQNSIGDGVWVVSMGHLMGLFDHAWLGIEPSGKLALLRYCEFNKVTDGKIVETAMYFDIPHLMAQTGASPFPKATAQHLVQPGPRPHDGLLFSVQPPSEGAATLGLINRMISDLGRWQSGLPLEEELRRTWAEDMLWWGPEGIGATYTIERYAQQHSGPFRAAFTERSKTTHRARVAEGRYGGFFGWPNFTARHAGGFMGVEGYKNVGEFRVIDIYRRDGDKLAENWIFIDLLHFWKTVGWDVLKLENSNQQS